MTSNTSTTVERMPTDTERRQSKVDQIIQGIVNATVVPMSNVIVFMASSGLLFVLFAVLWAGFGAGLILSQGSVDGVWHWIGSLPIVLQGIAWLLFLPVMGGLWVWESTWPLVVRLILVGGLAWWNLLVMFPRATQ
jgi:hypothetical protein